MTQRNTFTVRGGTTDASSEYGPGVRFYDTVSDIATAWKLANPQDRRSHDAIQDWIIATNHIRGAHGEDCTGVRRNIAVVRPNQVVTLPPGNPVTESRLHFDCPPERRPRPIEPVEEVQREIPRPRVIEDQVRAKLPVYPTGGNLGSGTTARIQDWYNSPLIWSPLVPEQPHVAARGLNPHGGSIQTVVGTGAAIAERTGMMLAGAIPLPGGFGLIPTGLMLDVGNPGDRTFNSREGSNGALHNDSNAGRNARIDLPIIGGYLNPLGVSTPTRDDATLLPGFGVQLTPQGFLADTPNGHTNNNQLSFVTGQGEYAPTITMSETAERSRGIRQIDGFLQATPSSPQTLRGTNNYAMAVFLNNQNIEPQIAQGWQQMSATPSRETAQRLIGLYNYQETLVGPSNYDVRTDVSHRLDDAGIARLNPRERIRYNRARLEEAATAANITGLDVNYLPEQSPIRSQTRAELREKLIGYYDILAENRPGVFRQIYHTQTNHDAPRYGRHNDEQRRAAATQFVDQLEIIHTAPEQSIPLPPEMEDHISVRRTGFNPVERFQYRPQQVAPIATQAEGRASVDAALNAAFSDRNNVQLLLRNSDYTPIAQAIAQRDNLSIELPAEFGGRGVRFNRANALAAVRERGYSADIIGRSMTREETHGILRNLPELQRNIIASADDAHIVELRQGDLLQLAEHRQNGRELRRGALGTQLLYTLANEPGNRTLLAMEANIRSSSATPEEATQRIETLRQGVNWAKEHISEVDLGQTHTALATSVQARELASLASRGPVVDETRVAAVAVAAPAATAIDNAALVTRLGGNAQASNALLNATGSASPEVAAQVLAAAGSASAADQLILARAALARGQSANALVASSNLSDEIKSRFATVAARPATLTEADAGFVLSTLSSVPTAASPALNAILGNQLARPLLTPLIAGNQSVATAVVGGLSDQQRTNLATLGGLENNAWPQAAAAPAATTTVTRTPSPLDDNLSDFRAAAAIAEARSRDTAMARAFFNSPSTNAVALEQLHRNNPQYMTALITQTMARDAQLRGRVEHNLDKAGDRSTTGALAFLPRLVDAHPAGQLSGIIRELSEAYASGNQREIARQTANLQRFVSVNPNTTEGRYHTMAVQQLYESILAAQGGRDALTRTIVTTIDNTTNVTNQPLVTSGHNADDTLAIFTTVVNRTDVGGGERNSELFVNTWSDAPVGGGINIPFIPVPHHRRHKNPRLTDAPADGCLDPSRPLGVCPPRPTTPGVPNRPGG